MTRPRVAPRTSVYRSLPPQQQSYAAEAAPSSYRFYGEVAIGYIYLVGSLVLSSSYLSFLTPYMANDLWWPDFNTSGTQSYLIDRVNAQLSLPWTSTFQVHTMSKNFSAPFVELFIQPAYAHRVLMEDDSVESAIRRMRQLSPTSFMSLATQYCWVDFNRRWELAHTVRRQQRCHDHDQDNAAVYMEAPLRLVNWKEWLAGPGSVFEIVVAQHLHPLQEGRVWVASVFAVATGNVDVAAESAHWRHHGMQRFTLQWQNYVQTGLDERMTIATAFGAYPLEIKKVPFVKSPSGWTSGMCNWGTWSDWSFALSYGAQNGVSLVTTDRSSRVADGAGPCCSVQDGEFDVMAQGITGKTSHLGHGLVRRELGPYLSIDMRHVPLPPSLVRQHDAFRRVYPNPGAGLDGFRAAVDPIPVSWSKTRPLLYLGGNPLCTATNDRQVPGFELNFGFDRSCREDVSNALELDETNLLMALAATKDRGGIINISATCAQCERAEAVCSATLLATMAAVNNMLEHDKLRQVGTWQQVMDDIVDVEIVQFATFTMRDLHMLRQSVVSNQTDDGAWNLFGWVMVADWVNGAREVVKFEGDAASLSLISSRYAEIPFTANAHSIPRQMGLYFWYMLCYVTAVQIGVAALVTLYGIHSRSTLLGRNLLRFHRVVGCVWIGRPLLISRGLSAVAIFSSAHVGMETVDGFTSLVQRPLPWLNWFMLAGEASWILYVVHDVMLLYTSQAHLFGPISTAVSWVAVLGFDMAFPFVPTMRFDRDCQLTSIGLACNVGTLHVGDARRVLAIIAIYIATSLLASAIARLFQPVPEDNDVIAPLVLPASAVAFLDFPVQTKEDTHTMDVLVCVFSGLLPTSIISGNKRAMLFDVKLWTFVSCDIQSHLVGIPIPTFPPIRHTKYQLLPDPTSSKRKNAVQPQDHPSLPTLGPSKALADASPPSIPHHPDCVVEKYPSMQRVHVALGFCVMDMSVVSSVSFVPVAHGIFGNDFFWAGFNSTGTHVF